MQLNTFPICNVFESVLTICCKLNAVKSVVWVEWVVQIIWMGRGVQVNSGAHWLTKRGDTTYTLFLKNVSIQCSANCLIALVNWNAFGVAMRSRCRNLINDNRARTHETTEVSGGSPKPPHRVTGYQQDMERGAVQQMITTEQYDRRPWDVWAI